MNLDDKIHDSRVNRERPFVCNGPLGDIASRMHELALRRLAIAFEGQLGKWRITHGVDQRGLIIVPDRFGPVIEYQRIQVVISFFQKCSDLDIASRSIDCNNMAGDPSHVPELDGVLQFCPMCWQTGVDWRGEKIIRKAEMPNER